MIRIPFIIAQQEMKFCLDLPLFGLEDHLQNLLDEYIRLHEI